MSDQWVFGRVVVCPARRQISVDGQPVTVGPRAFDVLVALIERCNQLVTKSELLEAVWPGVVVEENNVAMQVGALRKVLGDHVIETVPGRGYRFVAEVREDGGSRAARPAEVLPPEPATALLGRAADGDQLSLLLQTRSLVTLCGPGGVGKTALALHLAHEHRVSGVRWVALDRLAARVDVETAMIDALDVWPEREEVRGPIEHLPQLVVIDGAERWTDEVARMVRRLLERCPQTRVLVTSQVPLGLPLEQVLRLGPLTVPEEFATVSQALDHGAVQLFVRQAQAADQRFVMDERNVAQVVELCRRLDGLPLPLVLAAARVPLLGLQRLCDGLSTGFRVLVSSLRDAPPRHQTLEASFEWAHALLEPKERQVFRRLGVLSGPFSLCMAQCLAEQPEQGLDSWDVLNAIASLVDRSLVVVRDDGVMRYRLLNTTRMFALMKLSEAGESDEWRARLARLQAEGVEPVERR
jgi:predicted ATPase/DNA-binding winged helix-turn-helix (wHTH) protein